MRGNAQAGRSEIRVRVFGRLVRRVGLVALVMCVGVASPFASTDAAASSSRVRLLARQAKPLVRTGRLRSPTFARLLEEIERSSVIVLVDIAPVGEGGGRAGALHFLTSSASGARVLHVRLYPQSATWLGSIAQQVTLIAALGHELQHALEVDAQAGVQSPAAFAAMYRTAGRRVRLQHGEEFETEAAVRIGRQVERELLGGSVDAMEVLACGEL